MKSKKVYMAIVLAAVISMSGCGKKKEPLDTEKLSTTEATTETASVSSETTTVGQSTTAVTTTTVTTTKAPVKTQTVKSSEIGKNTADTEPKADAASPITGVSNAVFIDVSGIVREEASNSYREILQDYYKENSNNEAQDIKEIGKTLEDWKKLYKDSGDKAYAETGCSLILAYAKLASLDNLIYANMDKLSNEILAEHDRIAFDLQGNVEIFLNTNSINAISGDNDFACIERIADLRSTVEKELSKPVAETETQTSTQNA